MSENNIKAPKKLKILFTIVERVKVDFYLQSLEGFGVNCQTVTYARGTAPSDALKFMGFTDNSKAVILSVVPEDKIKEILIAYEDRYFKIKNGKGMAFTIPLDSVIGLQIYQLLSGINFKEEM